MSPQGRQMNLGGVRGGRGMQRGLEGCSSVNRRAKRL